MRCNLSPKTLTSQPLPNSISVLHNVGVGVYFEWNTRAHTAMEDNLLEELLGIANSDAPVEFGSGNQHLLSHPLSHWEWGDATTTVLGTFGMRRSCGFFKPGGQSAAAGFPVVYKERGEEWLAASQQFEKRCGPLMNEARRPVSSQFPHICCHRDMKTADL